MKKHRIKFKKNKYCGVVYATYPTDEETQELLNILSEQFGKEYYEQEQKDVSFEGKLKGLDPYHFEIIFYADKVVYKKLLGLTIPTMYLNREDMINFNIASQKLFHEVGDYGKITRDSTLEYTLHVVENSIQFDHDSSPTILKKAAKLWYRTSYNQAFSNGNKRTALLAALNFLALNYFVINDIDDYAQLYEEISMKIANKEISEFGVELFLRKHVQYDIERSTIDFIKRGGNYGSNN